VIFGGELTLTVTLAVWADVPVVPVPEATPAPAVTFATLAVVRVV
jgi:hypothetical protein